MTTPSTTILEEEPPPLSMPLKVIPSPSSSSSLSLWELHVPQPSDFESMAALQVNAFHNVNGNNNNTTAYKNKQGHSCSSNDGFFFFGTRRSSSSSSNSSSSNTPKKKPQPQQHPLQTQYHQQYERYQQECPQKLLHCRIIKCPVDGTTVLAACQLMRRWPLPPSTTSTSTTTTTTTAATATAKGDKQQQQQASSSSSSSSSSSNMVFVEWIACLSDHRGQGLGTQLLTWAADYTHHTLCASKLSLFVVGSNYSAQRWYQRQGFSKISCSNNKNKSNKKNNKNKHDNKEATTNNNNNTTSKSHKTSSSSSSSSSKWLLSSFSLSRLRELWGHFSVHHMEKDLTMTNESVGGGTTTTTTMTTVNV